MARAMRGDQEAAAGGGRTGHRHSYRLILLDKGRTTADLEVEREIGLGDQLDFGGRSYQVVGLSWTGDREGLLCSPTPKSRPADDPLEKERAWWSTEWRDRSNR